MICIFALLLIAACENGQKFDAEKQSDFLCVGGEEGDYWPELPISVQVTNDVELQVIDDYNSLIGVDFFEACDSENADIKVAYTDENFPQGDFGDVLGSTLTICNDGKITGAQIELSPVFSSNQEWRYAFAHELGHAVGFGHISNTIMESPITETGYSEKLKLFADDFLMWQYTPLIHP